MRVTHARCLAVDMKDPKQVVTDVRRLTRLPIEEVEQLVSTLPPDFEGGVQLVISFVSGQGFRDLPAEMHSQP